MNKLFARSIAVSTLLFSSFLVPSQVVAGNNAPLGNTYTMVEDNGNWSGECTNTTEGEYRCQMENFTSGDKTVYKAKVEVSGSNVLIRRKTTSTDSNACLYTGTLSDSGYISGSYKCKNAKNTSISWEAFLKK